MRDWAGSDAGRTWLARLTRWWEMLVYGGVPLVLMVFAVPIAFVPVVGLVAAMLHVERDLLSTSDGNAGRLRSSARAKTAIPPAVLPSVEHALLESFPSAPIRRRRPLSSRRSPGTAPTRSARSSTGSRPTSWWRGVRTGGS